MLFNSLEYILFLPAVVFAFWILPERWRLPMLLIASYLFYMSWNSTLVLLIIAMTVFNFFWGKLLSREEKRKRTIFWCGVAANVLCLAYFKYANFFVDSVLGLYNIATGSSAQFAMSILLPLGISFFVFEFIHYLTDVLRGHKPVESFTSFALFAAFFPTQIAGPIKRYQDFTAQMKEEKKLKLEYFDEGIPLIILGLAKKLLLANNLAIIVDMMTPTITAYGAVELWVFAYAFAFQIYFDFSGYTDIARGSALLFGYRIPINFNMPFMAGSMSDLWRRWHITLTNWLRDYVLIPISGFRASSLRFSIATMITMTVCGLWHGASWNFVIWGVYFGLCLQVNHYFRRWREETKIWKEFFHSKLFHAFSIFLTFHAFCLGAVIFRIKDLRTDFALVKKMVFLSPVLDKQEAGQFILLKPDLPVAVPLALILLAIVMLLNYPVSKLRESGVLKRLPVPLKATYLAALIYAMLIFLPSDSVPFIYFQF